MTSPISSDNPITLYQQPLINSSGSFPAFRNWRHPPCHPTLFKPRLSTVIHDNNTVPIAVMETISSKISTLQASSFYKSPYRKIINEKTSLESIQKQSVTPLVENESRQ